MRKKTTAMLLALLLLLTGCTGGALAPVKTDTAAETAEEAKTTAEGTLPDYPVISEPVTRADLDAIPVATPSMTEEELRQICISYMELMTSVVWTPDGTLSYSYPSAFSADEDGMLHLNAGNLYGGVPYTQAAADLEAFFDYYDETNGVVTVAGIGDVIHQRMGNNCGTAVFWAWQRVSSTINYYGTRQMCLAHGCLPVGSYTYDESLPDFYTHSTRMVCDENGEDVMMASYALLKPGDGVTMTVKGVGGHARMVKEIEVIRTPGGKVDPQKSYVICLEQASYGGRRQSEDGQVLGIGSENRYTFNDLYKKGYLPVTVAELCGKASVQPASASVTDFDTLGDLPNATLTGSYCISRAGVVISDGDGNEVYSAAKVGSCKPEDQYTMSLSKVLPPATLARNVKTGKTYTVTITARLGNGETVTAFTGTVAY